MQSDPSKTKMLRLSYERALIRKFKRYIKHVIPAILPIVSMDTSIGLSLDNFSIKTVENIIDNELYAYIDSDLNLEVQRYLNPAYQRGADKAVGEVNKHAKSIIITPWLTDLDMRAMDMMRANNCSLVRNVGMDTKKELVRIMNNGILQGHGIDKIGRNMRKSITTLSVKRSKLIARTEVMTSYNQGKVNKYKQGNVEKVQWVTALDDRTCEECESLDGQIFALGKHPSPPIHPMCRCTLVAYFERK